MADTPSNVYSGCVHLLRFLKDYRQLWGLTLPSHGALTSFEAP
jgi:hypothetical protein